MKKSSIAAAAGLILGASVTMSGCGASAQQNTEGTTAEAVKENTEATAENTEKAEENSDAQETVDVPVELDYAKGIADGTYGWTLSEDGSYYMLSAVKEDGTPVESQAKQSFMGGMGGPGGGRGGAGGTGGTGQKPEGGAGQAAGQKPEGGADQAAGQKPEGGAAPEAGQKPDGGASQGAGPAMTGDDPLAMEQNLQAKSPSVNAQGVYTESNITNTEYQTMLIYVPAAYMTVNEDGSASFTDAKIGDYTAATAPIVFQNGNGGWRSGSPKAPEFYDTLTAGMIYVSCGSRSRDAEGEDGTNTGKAPTPVADLKAGVIALRANADVIPGDKEKIISVGSSGGGQMSSALGATGNMTEYYPYLYEAGAIGVTYNAAADSYESTYDDSVYAAMCYCPIADIDNADLAYAWFRYDSTLNADGSLSDTAGNYEFTDFQLALQEDGANAFTEYINSLNLKDEDGNALTFDTNADGTLNPRAGSFYDATLQNISDALNATLAVENDPESYLATAYGEDTSSWLTRNSDGTYQVTDLANFVNGTGLVRNKDIPGFDTLDLSAENDAFGTSDTEAVHYSASIAKLLQEHYDEYKNLDGFDADQIDLYIQNALTGAEAEGIANQTYLVNATQIMLNVAAGTQDADIAKFWRTRNGTADQHTSFSVAYDICLAAQMAGSKADYSLVWAMGHGSNEGTTTGTFVDWINEICK